MLLETQACHRRHRHVIGDTGVSLEIQACRRRHRRVVGDTRMWLETQECCRRHRGVIGDTGVSLETQVCHRRHRHVVGIQLTGQAFTKPSWVEILIKSFCRTGHAWTVVLRSLHRHL